MNAKAVALLVVGIVLVSFVFSYFHVSYPSGVPNINEKFQVFQIQGYNGIGIGNGFGSGRTSILPQQQSSVVIQGYITNGSDGQPIGNADLFAFVSAAQTTTYTNSNGFYKFTVLYTGEYNILFAVYKYNTKLISLSVFGNSVWNNMSFVPATPYKYELETIGYKSSPQLPEPDVPLQLQGYFGPQDYIDVQSGHNGYLNVSAYFDSYAITVTSTQFSKETHPAYLNVSGPQGSKNDPYLIGILPLKYYSVSGYVFNDLKQPIASATVSVPSPSNTTLTNNSGFYNITAAYGSTYVAAIKVGFGVGETKTFVDRNLTDVNITLINVNPFTNNIGSGSGSGTGVSGVPPSAGSNISGTLGGNGNSSTINYGNGPSNYLLVGNITDKTTSQRVALTEVRFFLEINGTIFYKNVTTNNTGFYQVPLYYPGHYFFVVYSPFYYQYNFSIGINVPVQYWNFNLTPYGSHVFTVTGFVKDQAGNLLSGITVTANYVYKISNNQVQNVSSKLNKTAGNGEYSLTIFEGNYTFSASGISFVTNYTGVVDVNSPKYDVNITLDFRQPFLGSNTGTGTYGVNGPESGNVTSFLAGSGNGSNINFNAPGNFEITGKVTNANNSLPVFNTHILFLINVSGVYYYDNVTTSSAGQYIVGINFQGQYKMIVFSPYYYTHSIEFSISSLNTLQDLNFSLKPLPQYVNTVSGSVKNIAGNPVNTSVILVGIDGNNYLARQNSSDSSGYYSIYLVNDTSSDYTLRFDAPGYYNYTTSAFAITGPFISDAVLTPLDTIGNGVSLLSGQSGTGVPFLSYTALAGDLSNSSDSLAYALTNNTTNPVSLTASLENSSSSVPIENTYFLGFIKIDGAIYRFMGKTDSSGQYTITMNLTGSMAFLVSMVQYKNSSKLFSLEGPSGSELFALNPATLYNDTMHLNSVYNYSWHVPDSLNVSNSVLPITGKTTNLTNGTDFSFFVQNGTYDFSYINPHYVPASFYGNISGKDRLYNETVKNYLLEIKNNSVLPWSFNVTPYMPVQTAIVKPITYENLTSGTFVFNAFIDGNLYESLQFLLSETSYNESVNFTVTPSSQVLKASQTDGNETANLTSVPDGGKVLIYGISTNETWTSPVTLRFDNSSVPVSESSGQELTNLTLLSYIAYTSGSKLAIDIYSDSLTTAPPHLIVTVYFYDTYLTGGVI
ncbi:MAG: hypothetical protein QW597_00955 [Thermoplasmataceae archaeon]